MYRILITGSQGKMGQAVAQMADAHEKTLIGATFDEGQNLADAMNQSDCAIDFSIHHFSPTLLAAALKHNKPLVIGTTGHTAKEKSLIQETAQKLPIVYAPNFSIGVNALFWLTQKATELLKNHDFDIEVTEIHHRHKIDAPSGTANRLLDILTQTNAHEAKQITHGRQGNIGARPKAEIGMHTLRGGDVVGDHTVMFAADGERLELTHKASSRLTFASGALQAALWLRNQPAGLYDMQDVLGLN